MFRSAEEDDHFESYELYLDLEGFEGGDEGAPTTAPAAASAATPGGV
jgi:hypothetical protein